MTLDKLVAIVSNLCKMFMDDGAVFEEVIEMLVDAGADAEVLELIGFSQSQIDDYVYYEAAVSSRTEEEVRAELNAQKG